MTFDCEILFSKMFSISVVLFSFAFLASTATELCKNDEWFDDNTGKCLKCTVCPQKSLEFGPCLKFSDTLCADLKEIVRSFKWHEMEGDDSRVFLKGNTLAPKSTEDAEAEERLRSKMLCALFSFGLLCAMIASVILLHKYCRKTPHDHRQGLSPLFSRDRLNTTEYMNNLASLDRSLAMDDILEKKKRAYLEPVLLKEDVFVDISGLPVNNYYSDNSEHKKCLLQLRDH